MKISILIPCHNEEKSIADCVQSCLDQIRRPDEIVVVNDGSSDNSLRILEGFGNWIKVINVEKATGNKSYAQEIGLKFITGDVFIATDGDSLLDKNFVKRVEENFQDPQVAAVSGYVKSLRNNWLTACRELDYILGQNFFKRAQANINFLFVIPGCAGAFRTDIFEKNIGFDHDTLTEDLDFTYKLHEKGLKIKYDKKAITYTQDPFTLRSYINQMRRWYAGGWQNLLKHLTIIKKTNSALVLSLIYIEGLVFTLFIFILPLVSVKSFAYFLVPYLFLTTIIGVYGSFARRRADLLLFSPFYIILIFINAWVFWEQFIGEILFRRKKLVWFKPERANL